MVPTWQKLGKALELSTREVTRLPYSGAGRQGLWWGRPRGGGCRCLLESAAGVGGGGLGGGRLPRDERGGGTPTPGGAQRGLRAPEAGDIRHRCFKGRSLTDKRSPPGAPGPVEVYVALGGRPGLFDSGTPQAAQLRGPRDCRQSPRGWGRAGVDASSLPSEGPSPADPLSSDFWPPERRDRKFLCFKPLDSRLALLRQPQDLCTRILPGGRFWAVVSIPGTGTTTVLGLGHPGLVSCATRSCPFDQLTPASGWGRGS